MFDTPKTCIKCGAVYTGLHVCPPKMQSEFDRGYKAGKSTVGGIDAIPLTKTCLKCGQSYTGTHICPEIFKSDYQKGYDAGRKAAGGVMAYTGGTEFRYSGE